MIFRIGVLLLPLLLSGAPRPQTPANTKTDREWMLEKPAHITNVADYDRYPILAEKSGCLLVNMNGVKTWVNINPVKVPPLVKTNEYGFCENVSIGTNRINVYEMPDMSSRVADTIARNYLVQVVDVANYFVKIATPKINRYGWVNKKDLANYINRLSNNGKARAVVNDTETSFSISVNGETKRYKKGYTLIDNRADVAAWNTELIKKSTIVTAESLNSVRQTVSDVEFYQPIVKEIESGKSYYYYERAKLLYKDDTTFVIEKRYAFIDMENRKRNLLASDSFGGTVWPLSKIEFYNAAGDVMVSYNAAIVDDKDENFKPSKDGSVFLAQLVSLANNKDGATFSDGYSGFFSKTGQYLKSVVRPSIDHFVDVYDKYYLITYSKIKNYDYKMVFIDVAKANIVKEFTHNDFSQHKCFSASFASGWEKYGIPYSIMETYAISANKDVINFYDENGQLRTNIIKSAKCSEYK
ncbi:MAG: hypothetical protein HZC28_19450 [Spirochaetes bacterium]|nr:hypothetical protein [Spirochaetota bacterium]